MSGSYEMVNVESFDVDEAQAILNSFMGMIADCVCIASEEGQVVAASFHMARKLGYCASSELNGKQVNDLIVACDIQQRTKEWTAYFQAERLFYYLKHKDGRLFPVRVDHQFVQSRSGKTPKLILSIHSLTAPASPYKIIQDNLRLTEALHHITTAIFSKLDFSALLNEILEQIGSVIPYDTASISLLEGDFFNLVAVKGFRNQAQVMKIRFPKQAAPDVICPNLAAIEQRKSLRMGNVLQEYPYFIQPPGDGTILSWMVIPLLTQDGGIGTLNLDSFHEDFFTEESLRIGELFAAQISMAIENAVRHRQEVEYATHDALTGLYNRRHFERLAEYELSRAHPAQYPVSIIMLDLDCLKQVNDSYGHIIGDRIIQAVARILQQHSRRNDSAARFGGDEFLILMPDTTLGEAEIVAQRLCQAIGNFHFAYSGIDVKVSASIGVAAYANGERTEMVIDRADQALYVAKLSGKNRVVVNRERPGELPGVAG